MPGYAIVNLMELENGASEGGPTLEARFARSAIESEHIGVSHFRYAPGRRSKRGHSHREQEEVYVVLSGSGRVKLDDELLEVRAWDVVRVAPGTFRGFAAGSEGSSCSRSAPIGPRAATAFTQTTTGGATDRHGPAASTIVTTRSAQPAM